MEVWVENCRATRVVVDDRRLLRTEEPVEPAEDAADACRAHLWDSFLAAATASMERCRSYSKG